MFTWKAQIPKSFLDTNTTTKVNTHTHTCPFHYTTYEEQKPLILLPFFSFIMYFIIPLTRFSRDFSSYVYVSLHIFISFSTKPFRVVQVPLTLYFAMFFSCKYFFFFTFSWCAMMMWYTEMKMKWKNYDIAASKLKSCEKMFVLVTEKKKRNKNKTKCLKSNKIYTLYDNK